MSEESNKSLGIKEIAKLANVSIGTVDRVIHDRPGVSPKTKEKINKIIKEIGYQPNPIARRLAGFNTVYKIATIIPEHSDYNPFWKQHLSGIEKSRKLVEQFGIKVETLFFDQADESTFKSALGQFDEGGYNAAVIVPIFQEVASEFIQDCHAKQLPVVCIDTDIDGTEKLSFIGQNAYKSGILAGKLMSWQLNQGEKVLITHLTRHPEIHFNFRNREEGFKSYLTQNVGFDSNNIIQFIKPATDQDLFNNELQQVLTAHDSIKGIYVPNTRSFKVAEALKALGRTDLFVIGYDLVDQNIEVLKEGTVDVIISQKPDVQVYFAIELLYKKMVAREDPESSYNIPFDIILKENLDYYLEESKW